MSGPKSPPETGARRGSRAQPAPPHDPFSPEFLREIVEQHFDPVLDHYFRPRLLCGHKLPATGPAILAGNHSGTAFPWDAMALDALVWKREGFHLGKCRSVYEKELSMTWWMRPFGIDNFWRRGGGVDMTFDNFETLLRRKDRVLYYPEGVPGIGKGFARRYQLQRFSSSFVTLAARTGAQVVPIYIVNAEWVIPFNYTFKPIDRLTMKSFGVPFFPLPAAPLAVLFPFLWYLALPARMIFVVGDSIDVRSRVDAHGEQDLDDPDLDVMRKVADEIRQEMQGHLDRYVEKYGQRPYQGRSLRRALGRALRKGRFHRSMPWGWPWCFIRHARDEHRPPARNRLHALLRDWDILLYYLPLGWFGLALARNWRRPPHGYRGLSRRERKEREGNFHWHLNERPLP